MASRELSEFTLTRRIPSGKSTDQTFKWRDDDVLRRHTDLGPLLGVLPVEILHRTLERLDMATLARLQAVSHGMKRAVGSLPKLRAVLDYAPTAIRAVAATGTGRFTHCRDLYDALCDPGCTACGQPGAYLYMLVCERVCYACLTTNARYRPLRPMQAIVQLCLHPSQLSGIPAMKVPKYANRPRRRAAGHAHAARSSSSSIARLPNTTGWILLDNDGLFKRSLRRHGGTVAGIEAAHTRRLAKLYRRRRRAANLGRHNSHVRALRFHDRPGIETSLSAVAPLPWFDVASGKVARAVLCEACQAVRADRRRWYYTEGGFEEHERLYGKVVDGVHVK